MIRDFPTSGAPALPLVGRELAAMAASGLLYPFGMRRARARTPRAREQRTVVLVHGWLSNRACFLPLRAYLRARGVRSVLSYDYSSGPGIEQAALGLRTFLRRHVRGGRIDLVCHSLGGVVARVYLQELGGARRVDRCITLGTPHRGTYNAYWVGSRIGRELRPDSPLLARLATTQDNAARVRFASIAGGADNIVLPRVFAARDVSVGAPGTASAGAIPGPPGNEECVHVGDIGHLGLLFSLKVFSAVAERLALPAQPVAEVVRAGARG